MRLSIGISFTLPRGVSLAPGPKSQLLNRFASSSCRCRSSADREAPGPLAAQRQPLRCDQPCQLAAQRALGRVTGVAPPET